MTAKLKPIEPKAVSANGSRPTNLDKRPKMQTKRVTELPSPHSPHANSGRKSDPTKPDENKVLSDAHENEKIDDKNENNPEMKTNSDAINPIDNIPDVYKTQGSMTYSSCTGYSESTCLCSSIDDGSQATLKRVSYLERRNWITTERLSELRKKAQDAVKHHKIFTIRGCFYSIRKSLMSRGWVEKLDIHRRSVVNGSCQVILEDLAQHLPQRRPGETRRQHIQKCERNIMSRFLEHQPIDFLWSARKEKSDWIDMARNPNLTINKFHKSPFTTKEGLCNVLRDLHWFFEEGKSETYYPRSYNVSNLDDLGEFIDDYRLTACMSMLRFLVNRHEHNELECVYAENGQVPVSSIQFALKQCKTYLRSCQHLDIDDPDIERIWNHEWEIFLMHFQMLTQDHLSFQMPDDLLQWNHLMEECKRNLVEISQHWPQSNLDGVFNIWIVKPSNRCRGRGILLMNDIKKIIAHVNPPVVNKGRYVVQKYIERPMIIHNCKFDIRQWFLITSVQPLIIWMYKESYLRFSSQEYDLVNFHESVHLTNHAVQKRYENGKRDERLPRENMWDCHTFQAYLRQIGKASMWSERIFPGMQKALIGTMLASQDTMDRRSNTFELYGADFMISEDCQPWLIEINASPDLGASTSVTARLCPQCLEDVIKVVIDHRNDPKASTGNFEMIYRQVIPPAPAYLGLNLFLKGQQMQSKNGITKKEKPKPETKLKIERKNSQLAVKPVRDLINGENEKTPILSPRSLLIDFADCNETNSARRGLQTYTALSRSNKENLLKNDKMRLSSYVRYSSKPNNAKEIPLSSTRKSVSKMPDSSRRHASCGPKLVSLVPTDGNKAQDTEIMEDDPSKIKCVGNKCGSEVETNDSTMESNKSSPRKPQEPSRMTGIRAKLKPINTLSKSARALMKNAREKPATNSNEYRKYLTQSTLQLNRMPSKMPIHSNYYNSHFYAVGLSLRALKSKYNRIKTNDPPTATASTNPLKCKNI